MVHSGEHPIYFRFEHAGTGVRECSMASSAKRRAAAVQQQQQRPDDEEEDDMEEEMEGDDDEESDDIEDDESEEDEEVHEVKTRGGHVAQLWLNRFMVNVELQVPASSASWLGLVIVLLLGAVYM